MTHARSGIDVGALGLREVEPQAPQLAVEYGPRKVEAAHLMKVAEPGASIEGDGESNR